LPDPVFLRRQRNSGRDIELDAVAGAGEDVAFVGPEGLPIVGVVGVDGAGDAAGAERAELVETDVG
jgi:hypothetical protein